jgi:hypothetical protein
VVLAVRRVGGHKVGDIAHDEDLTGDRIENGFRRGPGIAAGDHQGLRFLALLGELAIALTLMGEFLLPELAVAFQEGGGKRAHGVGNLLCRNGLSVPEIAPARYPASKPAKSQRKRQVHAVPPWLLAASVCRIAICRRPFLFRANR